jgi:tRNA(Ile)-lysidine synthase
MLRQAMQALSPSARGLRGDMVFSILSSLASKRSGGSWNAGSLVVTCEQGEVRITMASSRRVAPEDAQDVAISSPARAADVVTVLALPGTLSWPVSGGRIRIRAVTRERGLALLEKPSPTLALFDAEQVTFPLTIRSWRPGDWFFPVGMTGRRKKLQDYFTDAKLGRSVREHIPLLLSQERIAWIVGQRIDARFAATASTTRFILARVTHALRRKGVF